MTSTSGWAFLMFASPWRNDSSTTAANPTTLPPSLPTRSMELDRRGARRDEVVDDEDPLTGRDGIGVHLEVLDGVLVRGDDADGFARQFPLLPDDGHAETQFAGDGRREQETPRFDARDDVGSLGHGPGGELVNGLIESGGVLDEGGEVLEHDARLGEIRHVAYHGLEVDGHASILSGKIALIKRQLPAEVKCRARRIAPCTPTPHEPINGFPRRRRRAPLLMGVSGAILLARLSGAPLAPTPRASFLPFPKGGSGGFIPCLSQAACLLGDQKRIPWSRIIGKTYNGSMSAQRMADLRLYLVADVDITPRDGISSSLVEEAVRGGVTMVQLRAKGLETREFLELATRMASVLKRRAIPLIINDRVDIALACGADGVHLGQDDMTPDKARELLGSSKIIGVSVNTLKEAQEAERLGADYVGLGPIYATSTKDTELPVLGPEGIRRIGQKIGIPIIAIGGISASNAADVMKAGAAGIAVVSAILGAPDTRLAAAELKARLSSKA